MFRDAFPYRSKEDTQRYSLRMTVREGCAFPIFFLHLYGLLDIIKNIEIVSVLQEVQSELNPLCLESTQSQKCSRANYLSHPLIFFFSATFV
jgi:hypothetical protein